MLVAAPALKGAGIGMSGIVHALTGPPYALAAGLGICLVLLAGPASPSVAQAPPTVEPTATPTSDVRGLNPGFTNVGAIPASSLAALVRLAPLHDSGVSGEATLLQSGGTTAVAVALDGLAANATYVGYLRAGGCDGPILFALQPIRADEGGPRPRHCYRGAVAGPEHCLDALRRG